MPASRSRRHTLFAATLAVLVPLPAAAQDAASDTVATSKGDLTVQPIHHASMLLTWDGKTILVDPAPAPGAPEGGDVTAEYTALPEPDLILVTDIHGDHLNADILAALGDDADIVAPQAVYDQLPAALQSEVTVIGNGETKTVEDIPIEAVAMYNTTAERMQYHEKGRGNGYILTLGDKRLYIAGDTEDVPEMRALTGIDVAFVPMNLPYTMTVEQAADAVKAFKPGIVYPYHYGESDVARFKELVGDASDVRWLKWY